MDSAVVAVLIPIVAIAGAFAVAITSILAKARIRELRIRERIAMIEKGLMPPPEVDPAGFERAMGPHDHYEARRAGRSRRMGIILMGIGFGLMVLRYIDPLRATSGANGAGGFVVVLGLAFLVSSFFDQPHAPTGPSPTSRPGSGQPRAD